MFSSKLLTVWRVFRATNVMGLCRTSFGRSLRTSLKLVEMLSGLMLKRGGFERCSLGPSSSSETLTPLNLTLLREIPESPGKPESPEKLEENR